MTATLSPDFQFGLAPQRLYIFWTFFYCIRRVKSGLLYLHGTLTVLDLLIVTAVAFYVQQEGDKTELKSPSGGTLFQRASSTESVEYS